MFWISSVGGDEPILSYEAVVQQECKSDMMEHWYF